MAKRSIRLKRHSKSFPSFNELVHTGMKTPKVKEPLFMTLSEFLKAHRLQKALKKTFRAARKEAKSKV